MKSDLATQRFIKRLKNRVLLNPDTFRPRQEKTPPQPEKLPDGFSVAVADADYQVRGPGQRPTIWDVFTQKRKLTPAGNGINRDHLWQEDIDLMKQLGVSDYRTSISMSRTLNQDGTVNHRETEWYKMYFEALRAAKIKVYATLFHWEAPADIAGGLINKEKFSKQFVAHARAVAENLDNLIEEYFLLNEPWCSSFLSYHLGAHAPGEENLAHALQAAHTLLLAQGRAFKAIKEINPEAKVSTVFNMEPSLPATDTPEDIVAATRSDGYFNRWFFDPLFKGKYPADMVKLFTNLKAMPRVSREELEEIKIGDQLNAVGINVYCPAVIRADSNGDIPNLGYGHVVTNDDPKNDLGWIVDPACVHEALTQVNQDYHPKRIYITENGMALETNQDSRRVAYFREHLRSALKAIKAGVPLKKYFAWTLMNNFEWAHGYKPKSCFGIVAVDRKTMKRTPKDSFRWLKKLIETRMLS
jgi:beta-glucosidase